MDGKNTTPGTNWVCLVKVGPPKVVAFPSVSLYHNPKIGEPSKKGRPNWQRYSKAGPEGEALSTAKRGCLCPISYDRRGLYVGQMLEKSGLAKYKLASHLKSP